MPDMVETVVWQGTFDGRFEDKTHAIDVFNKHIEAVKVHVPEDRLLVFRVKEGWEPLCAFLDVPVPDRPFPHLNDRKLLKRVVFFRNLMPYILLFVALVVFSLIFYFRS